MRMSLKKLPLHFVVVSMALSACSVVAERPDGGAGRRGDDERYERRGDDRRDYRRNDDRDERHGDYRQGGRAQISIGGYFGERQRAAVYYGQPPRQAHCPPGLAKKGNGCMPPGQAKRWAMGRPLPGDIDYRPVDADLRVRLGTPPAGYEFVRVAGDVLMIAIGTTVVIDAIQDLGR
jgi:Ni/Co efflux regulator RcnB